MQETVQRDASGEVPKLGMSYDNGKEDLGLPSPEGRRRKGDVIPTFKLFVRHEGGNTNQSSEIENKYKILNIKGNRIIEMLERMCRNIFSAIKF